MKEHEYGNKKENIALKWNYFWSEPKATHICRGARIHRLPTRKKYQSSDKEAVCCVSSVTGKQEKLNPHRPHLSGPAHSMPKSCSDHHALYSGGGNKNTNPEFSRMSGGGSMSEMSICCIDFDMSSTENGMLESSSSRNELLTGLLESSVINTLMFDITSGDTLCVPYLSSQYIVLILYSCCMLSTGQRSWLISSNVFFGFWWITWKNNTSERPVHLVCQCAPLQSSPFNINSCILSVEVGTTSL